MARWGAVLSVWLACSAALAIPEASADDVFPVASCKGYNGTLVARNGIGTTAATISGFVSQDAVKEMCIRLSRGDDSDGGDPARVQSCMGESQSEVGNELEATANCKTGQVSFRINGSVKIRARFPLSPTADTSCASGMPPVMQQFELLCPQHRPLSVRIWRNDVMMDGGILDVFVQIVHGNAERMLSGVIVNCGKTGIPQVLFGDKRWNIHPQTKKAVDGPPNFPSAEIWRATCPFD